MPRLAPFLLLAALPLALAACGGKPPASQQDLDSLDRELTDANGAGMGKDPALTAALHDQIMVDPALAQQSNANVIRPPSRPDTGAVPPDAMGARADGVDGATLRHAPAPSGDCPECRAADGALTLGALAEQQGSRSMAMCADAIRYGSDWSTRLPAALPLYPDARIVEAAGTDNNGCALRIVSFVSGAPVQRVTDWYYTRVSAAGFSAEHKAAGAQHILGGTRGDAAYILYLTRRNDGGTDVDLVTNGG